MAPRRKNAPPTAEGPVTRSQSRSKELPDVERPVTRSITKKQNDTSKAKVTKSQPKAKGKATTSKRTTTKNEAIKKAAAKKTNITKKKTAAVGKAVKVGAKVRVLAPEDDAVRDDAEAEIPVAPEAQNAKAANPNKPGDDEKTKVNEVKASAGSDPETTTDEARVKTTAATKSDDNSQVAKGGEKSKKRPAAQIESLCDQNASSSKTNAENPPRPKARFIATELQSSFKPASSKAQLVPKALDSVVEEVEPGVFNFTFDTAKLDAFHPLPWAVSQGHVEKVVVRVAYLKGNDKSKFFGFCVHLDSKEDKPKHTYCRTSEPWQDSMHCNEGENILTYSLSCELYDFLTDDENTISITTIHDCIQNLLTRDPGHHCLICGEQTKVKLWRAGTCDSAECSAAFLKWPLGVRISPLIAYPEVLDFLLSCCNTAAQPSTNGGDPITAAQLLPDTCPIPANKLPSVIDTFPAISNSSDTANISALVGRGEYAEERRQLLDWLCTEFKGCLIPAPEKAKVDFGGLSSGQFILMNHEPTLYSKFVGQITQRREKRGTVAFHGTSASRVFAILNQGLRSGGDFLGADGVYYAHQPSYSEGYMRQTYLSGWTNSSFKHKMMMFGIELSGPDLPQPNGQGATMSECNVMVRYVFAIDANVTPYQDPYGNEYRYKLHGGCSDSGASGSSDDCEYDGGYIRPSSCGQACQQVVNAASCKILSPCARQC